MSEQGAKPLTDEELESIDRKIAVWFERMERDDPGISIWDRVVRQAILARDARIAELEDRVLTPAESAEKGKLLDGIEADLDELIADHDRYRAERDTLRAELAEAVRAVEMYEHFCQHAECLCHMFTGGVICSRCEIQQEGRAFLAKHGEAE